MLNHDIVLEVLRLHRQNISQRQIAKRLGIDRNTVSSIVNGRRPDYELLRQEKEAAVPRAVKPYLCADCSLSVRLRPCVVCQARKASEMGVPSAVAEDRSQAVAKQGLELRYEHRIRYEQFRRERASDNDT